MNFHHSTGINLLNFMVFDEPKQAKNDWNKDIKNKTVSEVLKYSKKS